MIECTTNKWQALDISLGSINRKTIMGSLKKGSNFIITIPEILA